MSDKQLLLAHPYLSDRASLYASSEASASLAASNLTASSDPTDWWRSASGDHLTASVTVQLPTLDELAIEWDLVAPLYTNSGPDATWRVVAAAAEADLPTDMASPLGAGTWDSAEISARPSANMDRPGEPEWRHAMLWLGDGAARTEPWIRIFWSDPEPLGDFGSGDPFVQWGRLYVALAYRPTYSRTVGSEITAAAERPRKIRTQGGSLRVGRSTRPREFRFSVGFLPTDEAYERLYEFDRVAGASTDVLVVDDPEDAVNMHRKMIYGYLSPGGIRHADWETHQRSYVLEEA